MALRVDRVERSVQLVSEMIDSLDLEGLSPSLMRGVPRWAQRMVLGAVRRAVMDSLARLPSDIRADPDRAERASRWIVHVVAWLTDQTDQEPPAPAFASSRAIASPSSDGQAPARAIS